MTAIAIVGMGCRFADAPDLQSFWTLSLEGRDAFGPPPANRWDPAVFQSSSRRATDKSYAPHGAFIEDVQSFPALAFGLPPRRVEVMDPQQRFALEVCLQAIEDSGSRPAELPYRTGVFMGVTASEYRSILSSRVIAQYMAGGDLGAPPDEDGINAIVEAVNRVVPSRPFTAPGVLQNMIAATVAQELDLHGPAFTTDAACASAMVALSSAVSQLRSGAIDAALAGGVYLCLTPEHHIAFSRIGAMSASGWCRPFDHRADGFVQGDGAGAVLLKRLDDAVADGDRIYAVIQGVALNNDGRGDGPMAPLAQGQAEVIRAAWRDADLPHNELGYIEAHGTGTSVGDANELQGLQLAFGDALQQTQLGSSKANVGHTMSAAAIAGVIRSALAIHHNIVPPMAGFEAAREADNLKSAGLQVPTAPTAWTHERRIAGVSSFGFGGTNGHAVLANFEPELDAPAEQAELLLTSGPSEAALRALCARTAAVLTSDATVTVAGVARAWAARRPQSYRLGLVVRSRDELLTALTRIAAGEHVSGAQLGDAPADPPSVAFLYPGQGSQRVGMLAGIRDRFPQVGAELDQLSRDAAADLSMPVPHLLWPELRETPVSPETAEAELTNTANCQPALLAAGVALTCLLDDVGVRPSVVLGHSLGEFTAAAVGGVLSPVSALSFVARRGQAMAELTGDHGTMAALMTDAETAATLLVDGAVIANRNHPHQVVISGETAAVQATVAAAEAANVKAVPLAVSHAFHSPVLSALDSAALLEGIGLAGPSTPVASGIADRPYATAADARDIFSRHATSPVEFVRGLEQCVELGADIYLQVGAGGPLAAFARGTLRDRSRAIFSIAGLDDADGGASFLEGLARLWTLGVNVDPRPITAAAPVASIPPATYDREVYWAVKSEAQLTLKVDGLGNRTVVSAPTAPVSEPAAAPAETGDDTEGKVLTVVAKVSAYPLASLRPSMSLIDDLGFDSLMVNDLATGLADAFPGLPGIPQELLLNRPKVSDIVAFVQRSDGTAGAIDDNAPLTAYAPTWLPTALPSATQRRVRGNLKARILGSGDVADLLRSHFSALGTVVDDHTAHLLRSPSSALGTVVDDQPVHLLIDARPLALHGTVGDALSSNAAPPDSAAALLADLAQFPATDRPDVLVLRHDDDAWGHAAAGVVRGLSREWTEQRCKAIALASDLEPAAAVSAVLREWLSNDQTVDVRLRPDGRDVGGFTELPSTEAASFTSSDVVLITGGSRGIGATLGARIANLGATVLLLGRSTPGEVASAAISAHPDRVFALQADVCDADALRGALGNHKPTHLIHSAGVLADGPIESVDPAKGALARAVKVTGLLRAIEASGPSLHTVLALGSWAGRFGNRHQTHYAAANAQLSGLAHHMPPALRTVVLELGPWADSEMVATIPAAIQAAMRAEGVDFVGAEAGVSAVLQALASGSGPRVLGRDLPLTTRRVSTELPLSTSAAPFLLDHQVDGRPVLPLASATDLLAWAADATAPFEVTDVELFKGIEVREPQRLHLGVDGDRITLRQGTDRALSYSARVRPLSSPITDPGASEGGTAPELSLEDFYRDVTFHGPLLQGITAIEAVGDSFIRGRVRTGRPEHWIPESPREAWTVDPLVLDSVMQLSGYVAFTRFGRAGTPIRIGRYQQLAPFPEGELVCEVTFDDLDPTSDLFTGTLWMRSQSGELLAVAEDVTARLVKVEGQAERPPIKPEWIDPSLWPGLKDVELRLQGAEALGVRNPFFNVHDGTARDTTSIGGRTYVNFSSYNYLGLSGDPDILKSVVSAVETYGTSVSASRVASGERPFHAELEQKLAACQGSEDALLFTAGHATNVTTIGHLMGSDDLVLHDEFIHDSALQGIKLSGASRRAFRHDDPKHLEQQLAELRAHYKKVLIVVEGVYSMDGDICDLPAYIRIKKDWGCMLMVDEAHSFGIVGATGQGVREHFGIDGRDVDLWMGTLSKSLASCGGWISASKPLIQYLRYTAPGFVYSAGLTPANGVAALAALDKMLEEPERVQRLQENSSYFQDELTKRGLDTGPARGESAVVPVITGNSFHALQLSQRLADAGVNVQPIVYPAVPDDAARLRFFLASTHSKEQLRRTAELCQSLLEAIRSEFPVPS